MERRTQILVGGLVGFILLWQGWLLFNSTFMAPLYKSTNDLEELQKSVSQKNKELVVLAKQQKNLNDWKRRSLPPDEPVKSNKQRPDALNAQRLYQDWLGDIAQLSGFAPEELEVSPDRRVVSRDNVFISVVVKIKAKARFEQVCRFLDRFYRTDLLHRVTSLRIQSLEPEGDNLQILLEAEGLVLLDPDRSAASRTPQKRLLFDQTTLAEDLSDSGTEMTVASIDGFPQKPDFMVRLRSEFLTVTKIDGTKWTVKRAADATTATSHPTGTIVELAPILPGVTARSADEIKQLLDSNIFIKPVPPAQYKLRISPLAEKSVTRGKSIEFLVIALGYDPGKGRPEFALVGPGVSGSRLDKATGKFSWTPTADQKAGKQTFKVEINHPSAPGGKLSETVNIVLREPNTAPKVAYKPAPPVFLGREWKYKLEASDAESSTGRLTWKLGENPPAGLQIDSTTGTLTWTSDDSTDVGEATVQIVVSDDGDPPQSTTYPLKLKVQDDAAAFTFLTTIFGVDGVYLAKLYDRSQDKYTDLRVGTRFSVADVQGTVTKIDKKFLLFTSGDATNRLEIGQSLRQFSMEKAEIPDASKPANAASPVESAAP